MWHRGSHWMWRKGSHWVRHGHGGLDTGNRDNGNRDNGNRDNGNRDNGDRDNHGNGDNLRHGARPMCSLPTGEVEVHSYSARFHRCRSGRNPDGILSVGGLQMSQDSTNPSKPNPTNPAFDHTPVMVDEVVELFAPVPPGVIVDATLGGGGHARAILAARPDLALVGIDQDQDALAAARPTLPPTATLHHARFDAIAQLVTGPVSGVLFDLGVSSPQLDRADRGFSYRTADTPAPLDMRMDRSSSTSSSSTSSSSTTNTAKTAADIVNTYGEAELARLFADNGERRFARRIARAIVAARPLRTTDDLVEAVRAAIPHAVQRTAGHPAKRVFQAIRIEVNAELDILPAALDDAIALAGPGGRVVVLAYHSGEDRIVKDRFLNAADGGCTCPPGLPCICGATPTVRLLNRGARKPSAAEVAANPRAESARLRAVERLAAPEGQAPAPTDTAPAAL
jgi:16S rRNA (cytosine1402-N4)-methyltransferase